MKLNKRKNNIIIEYNCSAYRKDMYTWYIIKHDGCGVDRIRDDWKYCPGCGEKIIWEVVDGNMDGY